MSPKHSLSPVDANTPDPKRLRVDVDMRDPDEPIAQDDPTQKANREGREEGEDVEDESTVATESLAPTQHHAARRGIQRSIALVLKHDGFGSAKPEALESFTNMVETCQSDAWNTPTIHTADTDRM